MTGLQSLLRVIYPPRCMTCDAFVDDVHALCADCWRQTPFIAGLVCDGCGTPIPGADPGDGTGVLCDDCMTIARPWSKGRAALMYDAMARDILLKLKYADRTDLAHAASRWLVRVAGPLVQPDTIVAPVPLHWRRLFRRRYNQAALLSAGLARHMGIGYCPDLLMRARATPTQEGRSRVGRFANQRGAIRVHPRRQSLLTDRPVLLVDDVMTSGATLAAAAEACLAAGSGEVCVVVLARVAKQD